MVIRNVNTILNAYISNNRALKHIKQNWHNWDFNIPPLIIDRTPRGKDIEDLNNTINKNDLMFKNTPPKNSRIYRF